MVLYSCRIGIYIEDAYVHEKCSILKGIIFFLYAWLYQVEGPHFVIWWTYYLFTWDKILIYRVLIKLFNVAVLFIYTLFFTVRIYKCKGKIVL